MTPEEALRTLPAPHESWLSPCGLNSNTADPHGWAHRPQWHVLDTHWDHGLRFLAAWDAWKRCPQRPSRLFFTVLLPRPGRADAWVDHASGHPHLMPLARQLADRWKGLLPGTHRLVFEQERVQLILQVLDVDEALAQMDTPVDTAILGDETPDSATMTDSPSWLKRLFRLCRPGTRLAVWRPGDQLTQDLERGGCSLSSASDGPDLRGWLTATFAPRWPVGRSFRKPCAGPHRQAVVVGAGLAGSAVAWSLAQRGWAVEVLDGASQPAQGASALPAGLVAPHASPDDAPLSRLSRDGVRATLERARALLEYGTDWAPSGVLEHRVEGKRSLPSPDPAGHPIDWMTDWSSEATRVQVSLAHLPEAATGLWHASGGWVRPAALVAAQLAHPLIRFRGACVVAAIRRKAEHWVLLDTDERPLAETPVLVLACAYGVRDLLAPLASEQGQLPAHPLRGQVSWGPMSHLTEARDLLPPWPVNGHGSFLSGIPGGTGDPFWVVGSTFERGVTEAHLKPGDHQANQDRLARLLPALAAAAPDLCQRSSGWAGVRCTLPDRLPAVGAIQPEVRPGLHVFTGLGARGLTLSVLGGEVLAAQLMAEPWPLEPRLARRLLASRFGGAASVKVQSP